MARSTHELPGIETPPVKAAGAAPDARCSLYPAHYATPPVPAGSLTPIAMDEIDGDADTLRRGGRRFHKSPTIRTGVGILVTGALIGGMFGLAQHVQQHQGQAAAAHAGPVSPVAEAPSAEAPSKGAEAAVPPSAAQPLAAAAAAPPPVPLVLRAPIVVSRSASPRSTVRAKVATTRLVPAAAAEPKESRAPKEPKIAAAPPKEVKKAEPPPKAPPAHDESERILKAAQASTENSL